MKSIKNSLNNLKSTIKSGIESQSPIKKNTFKSIDLNSISDKLSSDKLKTYVNTPVNSIIDKTKQITQPINDSISESNLSDKFTSFSNKVTSFFKLKSILFWLFVIFILAFLGFNIFTYLSKGTDFITTLISPITKITALMTGETAKTTIDNVSKGSQQILESTSKTGQDLIKYGATNTSKGITKLQNNLVKDKSVVEPENADNLVDTNNSNNSNSNNNTNKQNEPQPIRSNKSQQGYCYIGKINDTRYCSKVSGKAECMSGDIYPTMDICINPNLRA